MSSFNFAELKAQARQGVHDALAVPARYYRVNLGMPIDITVRWHTKIDRFGDIENIGYSELIEGVNRIILNRPQLDELDLIPETGDRVEVSIGGGQYASLVLVSREPYEGPIEEIWVVALR